jgi:hypothetical protein
LYNANGEESSTASSNGPEEVRLGLENINFVWCENGEICPVVWCTKEGDQKSNGRGT